MIFNRRSFVKKLGAGAWILSHGREAWSFGSNSGASAEPVRVGLIGAGARGRWLAKIASTIEELDVVACCDLLKANSEKCRKEIGREVTVYEKYHEIISDKKIEAVIIATPLFLHFEMATAALNAGKHVYCEKTMTHSRIESLRLRQKATESKQIFQVGYQHRFNPIYQEIKFLIDEDYCGKIAKVECTWNRNGNWRRDVPENIDFKGNKDFPDPEHLINWRMYRRYSGGLVAELCSHQMDIVNWLMNDRPDSVIGTGGIDHWKDGRETFDNVNLLVRYSKGVNVSFTSLTANALQGYSIKILGSKGSIEVVGENGHRAKIYAENPDQVVDGVTGATRIAWQNDEGVPVRIKNPASDDVLPTENALRHFALCINEGRKPDSNADTGHLTAVTVDMGNEAITKGVPIKWFDTYN